MESPPASRLISVRDQQQARDWSLALISQGVESTLNHDPITNTWAIEVDAARCGLALGILKQYHLENRGWNLRRELPGVHLAFNWACVSWAAALVFVHYVASLPGARLESAGALKSEVLSGHEWWRLFTAMTLHKDVGHLTSNLTIGTLLLGLAMARHGIGLGLLGPWLAGALGNLAALFVYGPHYASLGASGMVLATLGILTVAGVSEGIHRRPGWKSLFATLSAGLMLFLVTGASPESDLVVHLGGFIAGLLMGGALEYLQFRGANRTWLQSVAWGLTLGNGAAAWLCALAR